MDDGISSEYTTVTFNVTKKGKKEIIGLKFVDTMNRLTPPNSIRAITTALIQQKQTTSGEPLTNEYFREYIKLKPPELSNIGEIPRQESQAEPTKLTKLLFFMISAKGDGDADQVEYMYNYRDIMDDIIDDEDVTDRHLKTLLTSYKNSMFIGTVDKNVKSHAVILRVPCVMTDAGITTTVEIAEDNRFFFDSLAFEKIIRIFNVDMVTAGAVEQQAGLVEAINNAGLTGPKRKYRSLQCISTYGVASQVVYGLDDVIGVISNIVNYIIRCAANNEYIDDFKFGAQDELAKTIAKIFTPDPPATPLTHVTQEQSKAIYFAYKMLFEDMLEVVDFHKTLETIIEARKKVNEITIHYLEQHAFRGGSTNMDKYRVEVQDPEGINKALSELHITYTNAITHLKYHNQFDGTLTINVANIVEIRTLCEALSGCRSIAPSNLAEDVVLAIQSHATKIGSRRHTRGSSTSNFLERDDIATIKKTIDEMDDIIKRKFGSLKHTRIEKKKKPPDFSGESSSSGHHPSDGDDDSSGHGSGSIFSLYEMNQDEYDKIISSTPDGAEDGLSTRGIKLTDKYIENDAEKGDCISAIEVLKQQHASQVTASEDAHREAMAQLQAETEKKLDEVKLEHENALSGAEARLREANEKCKETLEGLKKENESQLTELKTAKDANKTCKETLDKLKEENASRVTELQKAANEANKTCKETLRTLNEQNESLVKDLRDAAVQRDALEEKNATLTQLGIERDRDIGRLKDTLEETRKIIEEIANNKSDEIEQSGPPPKAPRAGLKAASALLSGLNSPSASVPAPPPNRTASPAGAVEVRIAAAAPAGDASLQSYETDGIGLTPEAASTGEPAQSLKRGPYTDESEKEPDDSENNGGGKTQKSGGWKW